MKRKNLKFQRKSRTGEDERHLLPVIAIPLVVIILMIIIVFADGKKNAAKPETAETQQFDETMEDQEENDTQEEDAQGAEDAEGERGDGDAAEPDGDEPETDAGDDAEESKNAQGALRQDGDPEILSLMKRYFKARASADAELMNRLYGVGEVGIETLEAQKTRMRSTSKYVQGFENITTYVKDGMTADSWLVYAVSDIRFHAVKTAAPMIMWCYVTKDSEGNYLISDNASLSPEILQYIDFENRSEEVRKLASGVNAALKEALNSDESLNEVYGVLWEGSPVWEKEDETEAVQILDMEQDAEAGAGAENEDYAEGETAVEPETMVDLTSGDICTDDFSGESAVLDDGSSEAQQDAAQTNGD